MTETVHDFRAMNTDIQVVIVSHDEAKARAAARDVEAMFAETERALSRFLPESELSDLNRSAGRPFKASPLLLGAIARALDAARETGGLFDPTVLHALVAAGYDRSFELLKSGEDGQEGPGISLAIPQQRPPISPPDGPAVASSSHHLASWRDVMVDRDSGTITLREGVGVDLGGIGKGWTVDRAADILRGFRSFAVDAGGDIYAAGTQDNGTPWTIGIQDPADRGRDIAVLAVHNQAVATSTTRRRRWLLNGREQHHLIDPSTGRPADTGVASSTVIANSVARAETLAKAALLLGAQGGANFLEQHGVKGVLVLDGGQLVLTPRLQKEMEHAS